jgi:hypothetical protein
MTDIVRIFEQYANDKAFIFHYGTKTVMNLIGGSSSTEWNGTPEDIYFLMDSRKGTAVKGMLKSEAMRYFGNFFLLRHSDLDQEFFNKTGASKYTNNIEPLITHYNAMMDFFACTDIEIEEFEFADVTDLLDVNMDGIMVKYRVKVPNYVSYGNSGSTSS